MSKPVPIPEEIDPNEQGDQLQVITIRMTKESIEGVDRLAKKYDRTRSYIIRMAIEAYTQRVT